MMLLCIVSLPNSLLLAAGYVQLVGVPGIPGGGSGMTTGQYVNALYNISIGIAALLAVVRIIFAGAKYILSDIVTDKSDAKKDIKNAIIGLLVVLAAVLLLQTVNRQLTNFDALSDLATSTFQIADDRVVAPRTGDAVGTGRFADFVKTCNGTPSVESTAGGVQRYLCAAAIDTTSPDAPSVNPIANFSIREQALIDNPDYTRILQGASDLYPQSPENRQRAADNCTSRGGNHIEIYSDGAGEESVTCYSKRR